MRARQKSKFSILVFGPLTAIILSLVIFSDSETVIHRLQNEGECTIAVIGGSVTGDGRPMIWKNRDVFDHDQRFIYYASYERDGIWTIPFIGNCYRSDTTRIYMGANDCGFAIMNSDSYNLSDSLARGVDDGTLMRLALETCITLADFERLLDSTDISGRYDCWNFGCLDWTGAAAMYECANNAHWKFNADDPQNLTPGYIVRANYSIMGGSIRSGEDRYNRAVTLIDLQLEIRQLDAAFVLQYLTRDLGNVFDDPYPLPYNRSQVNGPPGYIYNLGCTISNRGTSSAVVVRGVREGEDASLTTIFAMLGSPILSLAFPLWSSSGSVPGCLSEPSGAPVYRLCSQRRSRLYNNSSSPYHLNSRSLLDDNGQGIYSYTFPLENWAAGQVDMLVEKWHVNHPNANELSAEQSRLSEMLFAGFESETSWFIDGEINNSQVLPSSIRLEAFPNPFNDETRLFYSNCDSRYEVGFRIFDVSGRLVDEFTGTNQDLGFVYWSGQNGSGKKTGSGVYFCTLSNGPNQVTRKLVYLK